MIQSVAGAVALLLMVSCTGGGPGNGEEPDGIGGTGISVAGGEPDGIGGTGLSGTITRFGSIYVNGEHIAVPGDISVTRLASNETAVLKLGQVVRVLANQDEGQLRASEIEIIDLLTGPVDIVQAGVGASQSLRVMGQEVALDQRTQLGPTLARQPLLAGQRVRVSGLRGADRRILASRVERVSDAVPDSVFGAVSTSNAADASRRVGGVPVELSGISRASNQASFLLHASGQYRAGTLVVERALLRATLPYGGQVARVIVEGIADQQGDALTLGGIAVRTGSDTRVEAQLTARVVAGPTRLVVDGQALVDGSIRARAISDAGEGDRGASRSARPSGKNNDKPPARRATNPGATAPPGPAGPPSAGGGNEHGPGEAGNGGPGPGGGGPGPGGSGSSHGGGDADNQGN